jgi:hypothetical protein
VAEFFHPWHVLAGVQLILTQEDAIVWRWTNNGVFSAKSVYSAFFAGTMTEPAITQIWHSSRG